MKWLDCKLGNAYTLYDGEEAYYKQVGNNDYVSNFIALKERLLSKIFLCYSIFKYYIYIILVFSQIQLKVEVRRRVLRQRPTTYDFLYD